MKNIYIIIVGVLIAVAIGLNALTDRYKTYIYEGGKVIYKTDTWTGQTYLIFLEGLKKGWIRIPNHSYAIPVSS
jgi:hypothetical protein